MKFKPIKIKNSHKPLHSGPKRYRLTFVNENTFNAVWTVKLSRFKVWLLSIAAIAAIICLVAIIVLGTPLRAILPGYLKPEERHSHISNTLKVDSLQESLDLNRAYIDNIRTILTENISLDSIIQPDSLAITSDTLIQTSDRELAFTKKWEERERYNLDVIVPMAAKAMSFHKPITNAVADSTTRESPQLLLISPRHSGVMAIHSGIVIDQTYIPAEGYAVIIQHPNDFISRYANMADVFIKKGDHVKAGQAIGLSNSQAKIPLVVEIWHKGTITKPYQVLGY